MCIPVHDNMNSIIQPVSLFTVGGFFFLFSVFLIATYSLKSLINHLTSLIQTFWCSRLASLYHVGKVAIPKQLG